MLLQFIIALIIVGAILYFLPRAPLDETIKVIIKVVLIVVILIWALKLVWPMTGLG
jgi:hypothetical protein